MKFDCFCYEEQQQQIRVRVWGGLYIFDGKKKIKTKKKCHDGFDFEMFVAVLGKKGMFVAVLGKKRGKKEEKKNPMHFDVERGDSLNPARQTTVFSFFPFWGAGELVFYG